MFILLGRIVVAHPWKVIVVISVLCALVLAGARQVRFVSDQDSSLPNRSALTAQIHAIQARFESRSTLAFLVAGGSDGARMRAACALVDELERTPGVAPGRVYGAGSDTLKYVVEDSGDLRVVGLGELCTSGGELSAQVLDGLGPQRALVQAPNGDLTVYADLNVITGEFAPLLRQMDARIPAFAQEGVTVSYSGHPAFIAQNEEFSRRIAYFIPVIMLLVLLLHWEALRSWQAVVIPVFTGFAATALAIGIYSWLRQPLDTYAVLAPILVLAVGAGHSVQLLKRYMEEVRDRVPVGQKADKVQNDAAIVATLQSMGPVLTLAVGGASSCLFALLLLDVSALARFGLLAGAGICAALVLELTLVPAIRALLPRPVVRATYGDLSPVWRSALRGMGSVALNGSKFWIAATLLVLAAGLVAGVLAVKPSHSISVYTDRNVPVQKTIRQLVEAGVGPYVFDVMIEAPVSGGALAPASLDAIRHIERSLKQDPAVRATLSAPDVIDFLQCRFVGATDCSASRVENEEEASQIWNVLFGGGREAGLIDDTRQFLRVRAFVNTDETHVAERLINSAKSAASEYGLTAITGGSAVSSKALADGIVRVSLEKAALLIAIVAIIGGLAFRSIRMAIAFAIPSITTVLANFSYLGWSGTTLNVATAAVATIAVGVGLDYLIYIAFRIREAMQKGATFEAAAVQAHASAGGAALCVAMAVAVGYAVLAFSPGYLLHHWIAALVPMTMLSSLLGALFVFPFLLRILRPPFVRATPPVPGSPGLARAVGD